MMGAKPPEFCLTEYGQRMVEKNIRLAHKLSHQFKPPYGYSFDEWNAECQAVLVQAVAWFDASKGKLSTLATKLAWLRRSNINSKTRTMSAGWGTCVISMDAEHGMDSATWHDELGNESTGFESVDNTELVETVISRCSPKAQKVLRLLANGVAFDEIGEIIGKQTPTKRRRGKPRGFSKQYAWQVLAEERAKLCKLFPDQVNSGGVCIECGGAIVRSTSNHRGVHCPSCVSKRVRDSKRKSWRKANAG